MQRYFIKLSPACVVDSSTQQDILFRVSKDIQKRSSGLQSKVFLQIITGNMFFSAKRCRDTL